MTSRLSGICGPGAWAYLARAILAGHGLPAELQKALSVPRRPLVLALRNEEELEDVEDAFAALSHLFNAQVRTAFFAEDAELRAASLERLHQGAPLVLATPEGLSAQVPTQNAYAEGRLRLCRGEVFGREKLIERLSALGYRRVEFVEGPGEFAVRGAVVDLLPYEPERPVRVLYDGDCIESLRVFDPDTQAGTSELLSEACAAPLAGVLAGIPLAERLQGGLWLVEEGAAVQVPPQAWTVGISGGLDLSSSVPPPFGGDLAVFAKQCALWHGQGVKVLVFSLNRGEDERLQESLEGRMEPGCAQFLIGPLRKGFVLPAMGEGRAPLAVLSASELFGRSYRPARGWAAKHSGAGRIRFGELRKGDYVVHEGYGVARYLGLETVSAPLSPEGRPSSSDGGRILGRSPEQDETRSVTDCLKLEFRGADKLFMPLSDFKLVQRFTGAEGRKPRLSALDARSWEDVKDRVREDVRELAARLLKLQAERAALPGRAFGAAGRMEEEFAESFPYEETPDQRKAIEETLADMREPHPMDRVVVGDVGFGKTEVAMRAVLKCAGDGAQTAVLVPTTVLVEQHLRTFRKRFAGFPVRVEGLSRFQTPAQQKRVLRELAEGRVDAVIGTHRLLQADVRFKDLGLLVIDEEHRFGVRDKERLKALRRDVHCLTLSATPIPRTLYQSLSGLRGVSMIRSAPSGRQPIATQVMPFDLKHAASVIEAELSRGGQAFYLYNRVRDLEDRAQSLRALLPGARIAAAHGQLESAELERVMWEFSRGEYDLLVASTIIESGLDIPTANTLIVEDAQDLGLSQLYQLRGRIGRERRKAFCWLYYPADPKEAGKLSEEARARLKALRELTHLGSGFQLAMRDLEIRGAGDLLGAKQHGHLHAVGLEFYCRMLEDEVQRLRKGSGAVRKEPEPPTVDLGLPAYIPEEYLPGDLERIEFYKRLFAAKTEALPGLEAELADLSGPAPLPVKNLLRVLRVRRAGARFGLRSIAQTGAGVEMYFHPGAGPEPAVLARWLKTLAGRMEFLRSEEGDGLRVRIQEDAVSWLEKFLSR
ncbi:MAG: DEAD/DEAH box helicase [Elusimicrobiota bacterium]|jgi:transcription-repair coupling factor (superfamily II helicase)